MTYDELVMQYEDLKIKEVDFVEVDPEGELSGLCVNNRIFIRNNLPTIIEKKCILAEELGHYHTSYGNILDQRDIRNIKQERRARNWAYDKLVPLDKLVTAYKAGIRSHQELAEFLDVAEEFLESAINHFKEKYGLFIMQGNCIIYFEPLGILELLDF